MQIITCFFLLVLALMAGSAPAVAQARGGGPPVKAVPQTERKSKPRLVDGARADRADGPERPAPEQSARGGRPERSARGSHRQDTDHGARSAKSARSPRREGREAGGGRGRKN